MPFNQPGFIICQARFGRGSTAGGLPADQVINTFVFRDDAVTGNGYAEVVNRLEDFYYGLSGTQTATLGSYLHNSVDSLTYYLRDADAAPGTPGEEIESTAFTQTASISSSLPPDVAVCLSYRGPVPDTKRTRGRIYLGPFRGGSTLVDSDGRLATGAHDNMLAAMAGLASTSETNSVRWTIASRAGNSSEDIVRGYIDRAFDTQRRRDPQSQVYDRQPDEFTVAGA